ncbi:uncharacterized protein AKAW2_30513S [Aspergillus luchuensis]|uniref:Uncharacterized protein n=1 Tax=Aspergillus kawachii TaxID=1069201 RepID=A0A7R7WV08_ASPKA|nr:uncharacterized protein AKAW2_30513S [Aspergillus luchuensis]BCR97194.1 hypothetical protein AKAW2_30513S [Aspergillus luchuensis]BCS09661.1 hypothetical protein ALUC_30478S [Aspergillus luchuensis]
MPIFQDPEHQRLQDVWSDDHQPRLNARRQTISPWKHPPGEPLGSHPLPGPQNVPYEGPSPDQSRAGMHATNREELIQYIKSADAPRWASHHSSGSSPNPTSQTSDVSSANMKDKAPVNAGPSDQSDSSDQQLASPADIERPRSALHSGDFREGSSQVQSQQHAPSSPVPGRTVNAHFSLLSSSPTTPWFSTPVFPASLRGQSLSVQTATPAARSRAPSLGSFSSSYILKAPTSPLVHQANNTDLDFSPRPEYVGHSDAIDKVSRRRTLPPETFQHLQASHGGHAEGIYFQADAHRTPWDTTTSYHLQSPRRSLTSTYSLQLASSVQTPITRVRRPSVGSEVSSRAHAPMVGSYEESILRGRMSMSPSKPLDFTAQIGVLGKGKCKANLKCPPHVTIPFPAVFYSYPTSGSGRSIADDSPSPYVGLIDLDNFLPRDTSSGSSRRRRRHQSPAGTHNDCVMGNTTEHKSTDQETLRRREKRHRRAESPKSPPGGCYRIPQHGQLQIMIKNPNKTAVKLFLVPYDLSDMEPGTKTFIRQRSYSVGPIIDMPLSARKNYGTDRPEASLNASEDPKDKPTLRYLIHLNICCPSRGRFYLHSSIRVVFANRVPDGKEKLRNEIQCPDPRYTPYKPSRDSSHTHAAARSSTDQVPHKAPSDREPLSMLSPSGAMTSREPPYPGSSSTCAPEDPFSDRTLADREGAPRGTSNLFSPPQPSSHPFRPIPSLSPGPKLDSSFAEQCNTERGLYGKLGKGEIGYGGYPFAFNGSEAGDSLLARKLRGLDVHKHDSPDPQKSCE